MQGGIAENMKVQRFKLANKLARPNSEVIGAANLLAV